MIVLEDLKLILTFLKKALKIMKKKIKDCHFDHTYLYVTSKSLIHPVRDGN
jgi:hypothetical protein